MNDLASETRDPRAVPGAKVRHRGDRRQVYTVDKAHSDGSKVQVQDETGWWPLTFLELVEAAPDPGTLPVVLLHPDAKLPTRGHEGDAGLDLLTLEPFELQRGEGRLVVTGIAVGVPAGHVGLICGRSGLAAKGVDVMGGVVDHLYSGEVKVVLMNHGRPLAIPAGTAVAQMLLIPVAMLSPVAVAALPTSSRGSDGFGSTDGKVAAGA